MAGLDPAIPAFASSLVKGDPDELGVITGTARQVLGSVLPGGGGVTRRQVISAAQRNRMVTVTGISLPLTSGGGGGTDWARATVSRAA
jgi:hypothetical protein